MKKFAIILALAALALLTTQALAFHDEGVARCAGCHTMHNMENGAPVDPAHPNGNPYLLKMATASDMCLSCHSTNHGRVWATDPMNPLILGGGNFAWLTAPNINDGRNGHLNPIVGSYGGHNIIAPSKNSGVDPAHTIAPGGNYPAAALGCSSCHDPHGNTNFRMLYGVGHVEAGNATFTHAAPDAEGIYEGSTVPESRTLHTAYHDGMSAWCANCHGNFHDNSTMLIHPSGVAMGASIAQNYNLYNGSSDLFGGNPATSYIPDVAFEDPAMTTTSTAGPSASSKVACISCHRAHGSSAPNMGRWDFDVNGFLRLDGVESGSWAIPNPYDTHQRSLCNKCHVKDVNDALE